MHHAILLPGDIVGPQLLTKSAYIERGNSEHSEHRTTCQTYTDPTVR